MTRRVRIALWAVAASLIVLLVVAVAHWRLGHRRGSGWGLSDEGALWPGKTVTMSDLEKRYRFPVVLPERTPTGFVLHKVQVSWVERDSVGPQLPSRLAVRLVYWDREHNSVFNLIESQHFPNTDRNDNVSWIISQGHFANLCSVDSVGASYCFGTVGGTDFVVTSKDLADEAMKGIRCSMAAVHGSA